MFTFIMKDNLENYSNDIHESKNIQTTYQFSIQPDYAVLNIKK